MRVFVTGATGFIGSAVVRALREAGHEVTRGVRGSADGGTDSVVVDLADVRGMSALFRGADAVVHAAGTSSLVAREDVLGWLEVAASENVARAARHAGVRRLVAFSSTDASLAATPRVAWNEIRSVDTPVSAFGRIARAKEDTLVGLGSTRFEPVVLRAGWVYGEGDRTRAPALVREALAQGGLRVVGRGLAFVPTTYVGNLAHAALLSLDAERAAHGVYHVLDRELTSQQPFLGRISIALGLDLPVRGSGLFVERALARIRGKTSVLDEAEILRRGLGSTLDVKRARLDLAYDPPVTQEEGMRALGTWVTEVGGASGLLTIGRAAPDDESVAPLRAAAGAAP